MAWEILVTPSCVGGATTFTAPVIKLDSQMYSGISKDYYTKPSYKRPYIYMHETIVSEGLPSPVTYEIEVKSGDTSKYLPDTLQLNYLKKPKIKELYLTLAQLDSDIDTSANMEFPENYCYEIINKLTALVLEQTGDTNRLQRNVPLNQTMMPPKQG